MKSLITTMVLLMLTACSNVDKRVKLVGEYNDHVSELRWEVYVRAVNIDDPSRLKHRDEPNLMSEQEIKKIVQDIKHEAEVKSLNDSKDNSHKKTD